MNKNNNIIVATGGTGGHIFPAASLANNLHKSGFNITITTDERGLKFIDKKFLIKTKLINSSSFNKNKKVISAFRIIISLFQSLIYLIHNRPKFIFGMGGYASFPICFAGLILRIPFIIYENNLLIGKANKFLAPFAKKIFVSYINIEGINKKYKNKIVVVGNILRENIINFKGNDKKIGNDLNILVLGGSQAAKIFAEILPEIFIQCKKNQINLKVYQQCLNEQKFVLKEKYEKYAVKHELFNFTFDILKYYNLSNLVITRAGSSALAEFLNCKIPIIAIPLATSAENHQLKNAQFFMDKGFGIMIEEKNIKSKLYDLLQSIHKDKSLLNKIKVNQKKYSDENVFMIIKKEITKLFYEN